MQLDVSNTGGGIRMAHALCSALHAGALAGLQQLDLSFNLLAHDGIDLFCEASECTGRRKAQSGAEGEEL